MHLTTEDVVFLRTSSEDHTMRRSYEEAPPSYSDAITIDRLQSGISLDDERFYGDQIEQVPSLDSTASFEKELEQGERPPQARWLVKSNAEPSTWKLMTTGPLMSNATTPQNNDPLHKRRYRVFFPPGYEDVYLHKSSWAAHAATLPQFHIELYSSHKFSDRYEPEAIIVLGPTEGDAEILYSFARDHALQHLPKCLSRVEEEVSKTTRFVTFCESEFSSWDWKCKTSSARQDMRLLIQKARRECILAAGLVMRLEQFVSFVGNKGDKEVAKTLKLFRRSLRESGYRLGRMQL
ncbi:hypothetical protein Slin14017_G124990 [Septoria linicola]|nr:hypothetical protein Slin14017_G124990 [Septoria linicola]